MHQKGVKIMSRDDLFASTKPKEEQRADELTVPGKKKTSSYADLAQKLTPEDQEKLGMIKDYDKVKREVAGQPSYDNIDLLADQALAAKKPSEMSNLKKKVDSRLLSMPKKI